MSFDFFHKKELHQNWSKETNVVYPFTFVERLDRELDSGSYEYYSTSGSARSPLQMVKVADGTTDRYYLGNESIAKVRNGRALYKHKVQLIEPTKLLQGVMIDGFAVTQPENTATRKTLWDVAVRLLAVTPLNNPRFVLDESNEAVVNLLENTIAPQFQWSSQTLLWECLSDIGDVVDCIPRLILKDGKFNAVTFDIVNNPKFSIDSMVDCYTMSIGESYNEEQYNSRVVANVANIVEE